MRVSLVAASLVLAVACTPPARCLEPTVLTAEPNSEPLASAPAATEALTPTEGSLSESPPSKPEWPKFACAGRLNQTLTTATGLKPDVVLSRNQEQIEIEGLRDAGLRATITQIVESYRLNGTRYFVATTQPDVTKIHYSFFLYVNDEDRGMLELRSLSGSLRIGYYDLVCKH